MGWERIVAAVVSYSVAMAVVVAADPWDPLMGWLGAAVFALAPFALGLAVGRWLAVASLST